MDVGFNNKNTFKHEELKDVVFLVEATSKEQFDLWKEWAIEHYDLNKLDTEIPIPDIPPKLFNSPVSKLISLVKERNEKIKESRKYRVEWRSVGMGNIFSIGKYNGVDIYVTFSYVYINGHKIAFYEATSALVHHFVVENYLKKHFQRTHDNYTRWNHVDANNFHNCINSLNNIDQEPRDTVYKDYYEIDD